MSIKDKENRFETARQSLDQVVTKLGLLTKSRENEFRGSIRSIESDLLKASAALEKGLYRCCFKSLRRVWNLAWAKDGNDQSPPWRWDAPSWLTKPGKKSENLSELNAALTELIGELDKIAYWEQGEGSFFWIKTVVEDDLKALIQLLRSHPDLSRARSFHSIRVMDAAIYFLRLELG